MKEEKFLAQSCSDSWNDYDYSRKDIKAAVWDLIIVTAANARQAHAYEAQIRVREAEKRLPLKTTFAVVTDTDGQRIGSGGATLKALRYLLETYGSIDNMRILLIHSGGDSKRIPQYSACGKLFMPIPHMLPDGNPSALFDELLISMSGVPARIGAGIMIAPSDTILLFNPLQFDLRSFDAAAFSMKTDITQGVEHGVYVADKDGRILKFLHKQPRECLRMEGAVDALGNVDIDTGYIWLGKNVVDALCSIFSKNGELSEDLFSKFANPKACLSFYGDFLYPLAADATFEQYLKESSDGAFTEELVACRKDIWESLRGLSLLLTRFVPARYIHMGTIHELLKMFTQDIGNYTYIGWRNQIYCNLDNAAGSVNNALISPNTNISQLSYIEDSIVGDNTVIGKNTILSCVKTQDCVVPDDVVLHGLRLKNGKYVCRIYGSGNNPKDSAGGAFLGSSLQNIMALSSMEVSDLWDDDSPVSIWNARIYPEADTLEDALEQALVLYKIANGTAAVPEITKWKLATRHSLQSSFESADIFAFMDFRKKIRSSVSTSNCAEMLRGADMEDAIKQLSFGDGLRDECEILLDKAKAARFPLNTRIYSALAFICDRENFKLRGLDSNMLETEAYATIREAIVAEVFAAHPIISEPVSFLSEYAGTELPVRINFCGSPSDAAPYCLEYGGTMLNAAILLDGKLPVKAEAFRLDEACFILESEDLSGSQRIDSLEQLSDCGDPADIFALHKAVLIASGIIPRNASETGLTMESLCRRLGGGLRLKTTVDVPKGSGLGTSSILAAACIRALDSIFRNSEDQRRIYAQVFAAEQLMNTGGGWQDQVGGFEFGIKYIKTQPGIYQDIIIDRLSLSDDAALQLQNRFALIFSGQRRLARNILRQETNQIIRNNKKTLDIMEQIRRLCAVMRFELERGDITRFGNFLTEQFELVKKLDKGVTNACIDYIFEVCDDLIDGKSICGAGGGGFLQVILKKGVTHQELKDRIDKQFMDCGVEVWDTSFQLQTK